MTIDLAKLRAETLALIDGTTPGPWVARKDGTFWDIVDQSGRDIVTVYGGGVPAEHKDANARLIAAAPTLAADNLRLVDENLRLVDEIDRLHSQIERMKASDHLNASRQIPFSRDELGRMVREAWIRWAQTQPDPKPSWLVPYEHLAEPDKEADRQIGEAISRWTLIGAAARAALAEGGPDDR